MGIGSPPDDDDVVPGQEDERLTRVPGHLIAQSDERLRRDLTTS